MDLRYARTLQEAITARDAGFEPIECCFGKESVVGRYRLDHHGDYSHHLPVSIQANNLALRRGFEPLERLVVSGKPDPDSTHAGNLITGNVPPSTSIAYAVGALDLDPVGIDQTKGNYLRVPAFRMLSRPQRTRESHLEAFEIGKSVFAPTSLPDSLRRDACRYEWARMDRAKKAVQLVQDDVVLVYSDEDSRDLWHRFCSSLVVQYKPLQHVITFSGCTQKAVQRLRFHGVQRRSVQDLFGPQGFFSLYHVLDTLFPQAGCGGRADIGGSPQEVVATAEQALESTRLLRGLLQDPTRFSQRAS